MTNTTPKPLVSVCITTYNHEAFIADCLDGILLQETDFPFEIILGEDGSTDQTLAICQAYAKKYPGLIRLFQRPPNKKIIINGRPTGRYNYLSNLADARGTYLAFCDGDDYWTDPKKLQKQIDFLRTHPDCSACHHSMQKYYLDSGTLSDDGTRAPASADLLRLLAGNVAVNSSIVLNKEYMGALPAWINTAPIADWVVLLFTARQAKVGFLDEVMGVYRVHEGGVWSGNKKADRYREMLDFLLFLRASVFTEPQQQQALDENIFLHHYRIAYHDPRSATFYQHFRYCLQHAGLSPRKWVRTANLLLFRAGLLRVQGEAFTFSFPPRRN